MHKRIRQRLNIARLKKKHSTSPAQRRNALESIKSPENPVVHLQRTIGNQALQRTIHSKIQRQCTRAAGRVIFNLSATGIGSGYSHIRQRSRVDFQNFDNKPHTITIVPGGIFTTRRFVIAPGAKVITRASQTTAEIHGSIVDNVPRGRSVHDITVCP